MKKLIRFAGTLVLGGLGFSCIVNADTLGGTGKLAGLRSVSPDSSEFPKWHGSIWVEEPGGALVEYFWGGNRCPGLEIAESQVALLAANLQSKGLRIIPAFKLGAGGTQCLVHFMMVDKGIADEVDPFP